MFIAEFNVQEPPFFEIVTMGVSIPFVFNVTFVDQFKINEVRLLKNALFVDADKRALPATYIEPLDKDNALEALTVKLAAKGKLPIVIVPVPEFVSITTLSVDVGKPAPPEPPELVAQWVVVLLSQVPLPPTQ